MWAAKDQTSLHIGAVSPVLSLIAIKRRDVEDGSDQIIYTSSCDVDTCRKCEQTMIRRACTFEQSRQIMFESWSSCEWQGLLSIFEKNKKKATCLDDLGFSTYAQK